VAHQQIRVDGFGLCDLDDLSRCEQLFHSRELDQQIENLENDIEFYEETLAEERELLHQLETNPEAFERYARENFGMHKEGETITIIEYETEQDE
jgi:cell division protein FtsB